MLFITIVVSQFFSSEASIVFKRKIQNFFDGLRRKFASNGIIIPDRFRRKLPFLVSYCTKWYKLRSCSQKSANISRCRKKEYSGDFYCIITIILPHTLINGTFFARVLMLS